MQLLTLPSSVVPQARRQILERHTEHIRGEAIRAAAGCNAAGETKARRRYLPLRRSLAVRTLSLIAKLHALHEIPAPAAGANVGVDRHYASLLRTVSPSAITRPARSSLRTHSCEVLRPKPSSCIFATHLVRGTGLFSSPVSSERMLKACSALPVNGFPMCMACDDSTTQDFSSSPSESMPTTTGFSLKGSGAMISTSRCFVGLTIPISISSSVSIAPRIADEPRAPRVLFLPL